MSRVIHADFGRTLKNMLSVAIDAESTILFVDDQVALVRFRCGVDGDMTTTHFLAHRGGKAEVIPVDA
jgi:hypothetical protein